MFDYDMAKDMRLCFFDTETTGLIDDSNPGLPLDYRVIDFCAIVTEPWPYLTEVGTINAKLILEPEWEKKASQEAFIINGYSREKWLAAGAIPSSPEFWWKVQQLTADTLRVGQNVMFDTLFVLREFKFYEFKAQWARRYFELMGLTHRLAQENHIIDEKTGKVAGNLQKVYDAVFRPSEEVKRMLVEHQAKPDVLRSMAIFQHVMQRMDATFTPYP